VTAGRDGAAAWSLSIFLLPFPVALSLKSFSSFSNFWPESVFILPSFIFLFFVLQIEEGAKGEHAEEVLVSCGAIGEVRAVG
jgi:hypothetical protein